MKRLKVWYDYKIIYNGIVKEAEIPELVSRARKKADKNKVVFYYSIQEVLDA